MVVKRCGALVWVPLLVLVAFPVFAAVASSAVAREAYGKVPLQFEESRGQSDEAVHFLARGPGYGLYLTSKEAMLVLAKPGEKGTDAPSAPVALRMSVVGARPTAAVSGEDEFPGRSNHFIGNDPSQWRTNVPTYAKVRYSGVYPGIDLVYYGQQRQLEYDFVVAPGADPDMIALDFEGADTVEIDSQGELVLHTAAGDVRQHKPVVYQEIDGSKREIDGGYVRKTATRVGFEVAEYDRSRPLVIDPVLSYSTYLGGSVIDMARGIAIDADGDVYVTGTTFPSNFPTTPGALRLPSDIPNINVFPVIFVSKLDPTGSVLLYSSYFGSALGGEDTPSAIAVDSECNVYVTGSTSSPSFPTTPGAVQRTFGGPYGADAFVTKLNATGSALVYSTYLGGYGADNGGAIAVDAYGSAYVTGTAGSLDFPITPGAFQTSLRNYPDAFVAKLDPSGSSLVYSTFIGGGVVWVGGIAVNAGGEVYIAGTTGINFPTTAGAFQTTLRGINNAFVTKLDSAGAALVYSTYLGGSRVNRTVDPDNALTYGTAIAIDASGSAYVTGWTNGSDFPVTPGAFQRENAFGQNQDAFVTKLNPVGSALVYSTYLGGSSDDDATAIAVDVDGNAFVTGSTVSTNFPQTADACEPGFRGNVDAFVTMLNPTGSALVYSTFLGGSGVDRGQAIAVDAGGNAYVAGETGPYVPLASACDTCTAGANDFPTTPNAFQPLYGRGQKDAFVVRVAAPVLPIMPSAETGSADTASPQMPASTSASVADSGQSAGSGGGGGAIDWLTLPALLAALGVTRRRRAQRA